MQAYFWGHLLTDFAEPERLPKAKFDYLTV